MRGHVSPDGGEPRLAIMVLGDADGAENVEAVVDTGFDGELSLSSRMVRRLGLPYAGSARATLADGSRTWFDYHEGRVLWHGEERAVAVLASDGDALIGMALLDGGRLTVDAVPGGDVRIEKLRG